MENKNNNWWFLWVLAILFIALKLMRYISWSWIWVLCPIWGQFALGVVIVIFKGIADVIKDNKNRQDQSHWMDAHENEWLLHQMWTGDKDDEE